jgi:hypothetical protein
MSHGARCQPLTSALQRQQNIEETKVKNVLEPINLTLKKYHDSKNRLNNGAVFARMSAWFWVILAKILVK